ncbi:cyclic nucleotide-gated cation channel alpha-3 isoform X2 [Anthonomus grandis grandis]|uniref:cyclic nucleotide-gated cation channel alpha-3 isoform X2 n=1 Tax=Anthonomus grandis grandis TaxID=2921223 RepID=UPI002166594C|nr:cyclic nucleotide-gated cation channel alpha-3 isoform X2 [Anthonomus grandis grandis]
MDPDLYQVLLLRGDAWWGERLRGSGGGLDMALSPPSRPTAHKNSQESVNRVLKSVSKQSLLNLVGCKLGMNKCGPSERSSFHQEGFFSSSRDSLPAAYVNRAANVSSASELDLSRKHRRKDLRSRLKLPTSVTLASSGEGPLLGGWRTGPGSTAGTNPPSTNHLSSSSCNGTESRYGFRRVDSYSGRLRGGPTGWSFVFDPAGRLCYYWSMIVSLACLYNLWVIIYRFAFREIDSNTILVWFCLDYFADFLYLMDILVHFRTGYLEDGVLQTDAVKLRQHYMNSTTFYIDCLCLLPLDFLYLSIGFNSILRLSRLIKLYRFWAFMDRTERHTNYPNFVRSSYLIHTLLVVFHWNGCVFHLVLKNDGFGSKNWVYSENTSGEGTDHVKAYLQSYYWCTLALTTIGDLPRPRSKPEYIFVIFQLLFGLLLFASVMGHVANIVTSVSAARKEFQAKLDGVKTYMRMRRVPSHLQVKVIKWFDYLWLTQKCSDEEKAVSCLPDKLKAEIAINVHLDTLKRVEIFQNTEAGFLCELVLKLRPVLFSPGDYICRKGEVGKEMYIVNRGRLQVVADNGRQVLATLKAGSYFGEISILNMGTAGNRRTASVRSVGYSDLFVLSKKDMWDVLKEYPAARVRLEAIAVKRLEKYKRAPLEKAAMGRSQSTPGLVESRGKVTLEDMWIPPISLVGPLPIFSRPQGTISPPQSIQPVQTPDSPGGSTSSDKSRQSRQSRHQSSHARSGTTINGGESMTQLMSGRTTPHETASHEILEQEIKRLRERLQMVESENAAMSLKLSQQQWELEHRLAEIEMQICGSPTTSSLDEEDELDKNRESII